MWCSHPTFPYLCWQIYDYYTEPNAGLFGIRKACETLHVQANIRDWTCRVINKMPQPVTDVTAAAEFYDIEGKKIGTQTESRMTVPANGVVKCFDIQWPAEFAKEPSKTYFLRLSLTDTNAIILSDNIYWHNSATKVLGEGRGARSDPPENFADLEKMPRVRLSGSMSFSKKDDRMGLVAAAIENPSPSIAFMVRLKLVKGTSGQRVLPVFYQDNYFTLLPGQKKQVPIEFYLEDLAGQPPKLLAEGYNVEETEIAPRKASP
jgi:hypothetical protein